MKKKLLIFHPALAPYRIDQFNMLNEIFDLHIVFIFENVWNHKFNQKILLNQLNFTYSYLLIGPRYKGRVFRFGILNKIKQLKPDIILGYEYSFITLYICLLKKLRIIQQEIGTTVDDSLGIASNLQNSFRGLSRKLLLTNINFLVLLSESVADYYTKVLNVDPSKIIISPILQNPQRLRHDSTSLIKISNLYLQQYGLLNYKVLIFVGRFIPEKGLIEFVHLIAPILLNNSRVKLLLIGDGDQKPLLESTITDLHLVNSVFLPGRFEGNELYAWYLCGSGFVLPSIYEPFGAVLNEALIFGLPVFCSKNVGSRFLTNSIENIFDPENISESRQLLFNFINLLQPINDINTELPNTKLSIDYDSPRINWIFKCYENKNI